jgi:hypothetical protein
MKNVFKVLGIIALVAVIGFSMAACGGDDDGGGGGGDKKADLVGIWSKDGGNLELTVTVSPNSGTYRLSSTNTPTDGIVTFDILSYNGTTVTTSDPDKYKSFTAQIAGNKLTISGASSSFDGTYTKQ